VAINSKNDFEQNEGGMEPSIRKGKHTNGEECKEEVMKEAFSPRLDPWGFKTNTSWTRESTTVTLVSLKGGTEMQPLPHNGGNKGRLNCAETGICRQRYQKTYSSNNDGNARRARFSFRGLVRTDNVAMRSQRAGGWKSEVMRVNRGRVDDSG